MDKENVVYLYNGILFSLEDKGNLAIYDNMDKPLGQYARRNETKTSTAWNHLYVESERNSKNELTNTEKRLVEVGSGQNG